MDQISGLRELRTARFDGTNYLIGFQEKVPDQRPVSGQLISQTGALVGSKVATDLQGGVPAVAFDGSNYFLVTEEDASVSTFLYGQFISTSGAKVGSPINITTGGINIKNLVMIFDGANYFVAWIDNRTLKGRFVSPAGQLIGSEIIICAGTAPDDLAPAYNIGFDGTNILAAWADGRRGAICGTAICEEDIYGQFISKSGVGTPGALSGSNFPINVNNDWSDRSTIGIAFDGTNYLIAWNDVTPGTENARLYAQLISTSGSPVGGVISSGPTGSDTSPSPALNNYRDAPVLAFDGINYLLTWAYTGNDTNHDGVCDAAEGTCWDVYGQFISTTGALQGPSFLIDGSPLNQFAYPVFAAGKYLIVIYTFDFFDGGGQINGEFLSPASIAAGFSTADLAGTWYFFGFDDSPSVNDPGWSRGTITMDSSGAITSGSGVDSDGSSSTFTGGSLSLSSAGVMSGSFTVNRGGTTHTSAFSLGKMDANKTMASFVFTDDGNYRNIVIAVKAGGSFTTADLAGTWYFFGFGDSPSVNDPSCFRGTITMDSSGTITSSSNVDCNGSSSALTGSMSLSSGGLISGSITPSGGGSTFTISQGKMDANKTMASFVGTDSTNRQSIIIGVKAGGSFTTADLAGTWHFFGFEDSPTTNDPGWIRGTMTMDSSGTITSGSDVDSYGCSSTFTGGSFSLSSDGVMSGSFTVNRCGVPLSNAFSQGKMDANKTMASFVFTDTRNYRNIIIGVKADDELTAASQLVSCPTDSLQTAVSNADPGLALLVSGTCNENILIDNNKMKVYLIGDGVSSTINGGSYNPTNPTNSGTRFGPETLDVRGKAILIQGLIITGGRNAILVHRSANAVINGNIVENAAEVGIGVEQEAFAVITGNTVQSNGGDGIRVSTNSGANIGFNNDWDTSPGPNIIQGNGGGGIHIEKSSHANIAGNLITNNNGDGVAVLRISHADIEGNEIHGNGGNGVLVSNNSEADLGNNSSPISFFNAVNTTTGTNTLAGIQCDESSVARGHQGTLNGAGGAQIFSPSCVTTNLVNP